MPIISSLLVKYIPNNPISYTVFPPPPTFVPERDIPDLSGKVVIVTGGNSGLGYQTALQLLPKNAKVYIAARSVQKASEAVAQLKQATGKEALVLSLDLGDLNSVKKAAAEFLEKENKLDILYNNAGVMLSPLDQLTSQGYDLQFGTNVLGHYYLTMLLLPALQRSTTINGIRSRVINLSSEGHLVAPGEGIDWSAVKGGPERDVRTKKWGTSLIPGMGAAWKLYGLSKMGNILFTHILNRYHGEDLISISIHPGAIQTDLQRNVSSFGQWMARKLLLFPPWMGALNQLWAGTMPEAENTAIGAYLVPWARIVKADKRSDNEATQDELKAYLEEQVRLFEASVST